MTENRPDLPDCFRTEETTKSVVTQRKTSNNRYRRVRPFELPAHPPHSCITSGDARLGFGCMGPGRQITDHCGVANLDSAVQQLWAAP